jgi:hypothetical protein
MDTNKNITNQRIEEIPLDLLKPAAYQRKTNTSQIKGIIARFDEAKLGLPVVSERDDAYYLIDGAHRAAAMRLLGYSSAKCIVLSGMSYEDEADFFRKQNENSRRINALNAYKAGLEARDVECVTIDALTNKYGFIVGSKGANGICSVFALTTIYKAFGADILDKTLSAIHVTWPHDEMARKREFLVGIAEFMSRFNIPDFKENLGIHSPSSIWRKYKEYADDSTKSSSDPALRKTFCRALVHHYNKSIRYRKNWLVMEDE